MGIKRHNRYYLIPAGGIILVGLLWLVFISAAAIQAETSRYSPMMQVTDCVAVSEIPVAECNALVNFYTNTDGANWTTNTGWNTTDTPCSWYGVTCNGGFVSQLDLSGNRLEGTLTDLSTLANLTTLNLSANQLVGSIPVTLPTSLTTLDLASNQLSGSIPDLSAMSNLIQLTLHNNQFSGEIPVTFTSLTSLSTLNISYNALTAADSSVDTFLDTKQPGWETTQTVSVKGLAVKSPRSTWVNLIWTAIPYTGDGGYYEISYSDSINGPWTVQGTTSNKTATSYTVTGIDTSITYFRVRTYTPPHGAQQNALWSDAAIASYDPDTYYGIPVAEYETLLNLYTSTNGQWWSYRSGWLQNEEPCTWVRVFCSGGHVRTLQLFLNNLSGTLPNLSALTELQYLYLNNNNISGTVPDLSSLISLRIIYLQNNNFSGNIPALSALTALTSVQLDNNSFTGSVPDLSGLSSLSSFYAMNNRLDGTIPSLWGLPNLQYLILNNNVLMGALPDLSALTALQYLELADNGLSGSVPAVYLPTSLLMLDLSYNNLEGDLPDFSGFTSLRTVLLQYNQFTGAITDLSGLTSLRRLYLHDNSIGGTFPDLPTSIENLRLQNNRISGTIPTMSGYSGLQYLWLENNQLTGEIPPSLAGLTGLLSLRLDYNALVAVDSALVDFLDSLNPGWDLTQTMPVTNLQVWDFTQTSADLIWKPILYTSDGGYYQASYAIDPGGPWTVAGQTADKFASSYTIYGLETNIIYYLRIQTFTPAHDLQQSDLWSDYTVTILYDVGWGWISEQELFQQMQANIIDNPALSIDVVVVDFQEGVIECTVRVADGTLVKAMITIEDVGPYAVAQFTSVTVGGVDAVATYSDLIYLELMPLVMDSIIGLFEQKVGVDRDLERIAIMDTMIEAAFLP